MIFVSNCCFSIQETLLQVKPGHCAESIQLGICTRSLSLCVLLKKLKLKWAPYVENKVENMYTAVFFPKSSIFLTSNSKGDGCGYFVSVQRKRSTIITQRKRWVLPIRPSLWAQCWLVSLGHPWLLLEAWPAGSQCRAQAGPGHGESKHLSGAAKGSCALRCCSRKVSLGDKGCLILAVL